MITCPNCSHVNEDHYKFCLACGTELNSKAAPAPTPKKEEPVSEPSEARRPRLSGLQERLNAIKEYRESQAPASVAPEPVGQKSSTGWTSPPSKAPGPIESLSGAFRAVDTEKESEHQEPSGVDNEPVEPVDAQLDGNEDGSVDHYGDDVSAKADIPSEGQDDEPEALSASQDDASVAPSLSHMIPEKEATEANVSASNLKATQDLDVDVVLSSTVDTPDSLANEVASSTGLKETASNEEDTSDGESEGPNRFETVMDPPPDILSDSGGAEQPFSEALGESTSSEEPEEHSGAHVVVPSVVQSSPPTARESQESEQKAKTEPAIRYCGSCGAEVPASFRFCGACGASMGEVEEPPAAPVVSIGELVLIHPDGTEGEHFDLGDGNVVVGRGHEHPLFSGDPYLSPEHARFEFRDGWFTVVDLDSFNGVYIRLRAEVRVDHSDLFRIGQQLLRFENARGVVDAARPLEDGTMIGGSPSSGIWGRISQVHTVDATLGEWMLTTPEIYLGRERGTITFPADLFVSASHCRLRRGDGFAYLSDLGSTNGSYARIKDQTALSTGDLILLGQQLFRIQLA